MVSPDTACPDRRTNCQACQPCRGGFHHPSHPGHGLVSTSGQSLHIDISTRNLGRAFERQSFFGGVVVMRSASFERSLLIFQEICVRFYDFSSTFASEHNTVGRLGFCGVFASRFQAFHLPLTILGGERCVILKVFLARPPGIFSGRPWAHPPGTQQACKCQIR